MSRNILFQRVSLKSEIRSSKMRNTKTNSGMELLLSHSRQDTLYENGPIYIPVLRSILEERNNALVKCLFFVTRMTYDRIRFHKRDRQPTRQVEFWGPENRVKEIVFIRLTRQKVSPHMHRETFEPLTRNEWIMLWQMLRVRNNDFGGFERVHPFFSQGLL